MSKKKARLFLCNNTNFLQYHNLYLRNKPLIKINYKKYDYFKTYKHYIDINYKSLQYSTLYESPGTGIIVLEFVSMKLNTKFSYISI